MYAITEPDFVLDVVYTSTEDGSIYLVTDCSDPAGSCVAGADDVFGIGPELTGSLTCPPVAVKAATRGATKGRYHGGRR